MKSPKFKIMIKIYGLGKTEKLSDHNTWYRNSVHRLSR